MTGGRQRVALVTGASSGIGGACVRALHDAGLLVYASARQPATLGDFADQGIATLPLDVTDEASLQQAVTTIQRSSGAIDVLVNNAGYALQLPIEQAPMQEVRRQFETNVFGAARLAQLVLPGMRAQRAGRIVNIGSMGGRFTLPGGGYYHATKHALEALSDALRLETAGFGVRVVLIEPGPVQTGFGVRATQSMGASQSEDVAAVYESFNVALGRVLARAYDGRRRRFGLSASDVADVVVKAATTRHPRPRYAVGLTARALITGRRLLPDQAWDEVIRRIWPTP
ncbi:MAG TPA: oxidoreductase [Actinomycetes bacterium]|nr:oxidoreductase [Actinomycetes bacterium]